MKGNLVKTITSNKMFGKVASFYLSNESVILTGGTIGFSLATTSVALRNAAKIQSIVTAAKNDLRDYPEDKKEIYGKTIKLLAPLISPIIIFQTATIITTVMQKKQSDKKLAEAAGALSLAQNALTQYKEFTKAAEKELGKKKTEKLDREINESKEYEPLKMVDTLSKKDGDILLIDPYSGRSFYGTEDRIKAAVSDLRLYLRDNEFASLNDPYYQDLGLEDTELGEDNGWQTDDFSSISYQLCPTRILTNEGLKPGFAVEIYPKPSNI